jgi:hypothetical protein
VTLELNNLNPDACSREIAKDLGKCFQLQGKVTAGTARQNTLAIDARIAAWTPNLAGERLYLKAMDYFCAARDQRPPLH